MPLGGGRKQICDSLPILNLDKTDIDLSLIANWLLNAIQTSEQNTQTWRTNFNKLHNSKTRYFAIDHAPEIGKFINKTVFEPVKFHIWFLIIFLFLWHRDVTFRENISLGIWNFKVEVRFTKSLLQLQRHTFYAKKKVFAYLK